jgi:selenocysteine-specific elongation factor
MPQTREHLAIAELLGVRHGSVALTKADRVPPERLAAARAEVAALLAATPLDGAPVFATNAADPQDAGVAALREHLFATARAFAPRARQGLFRLAVDRAFTLAGQGTVVTGTVFGGSVRVGDGVRHSASGTLARVRSIHAQNRASDSGHAGQRVALNLAGINRDAIARGDWVADPLALHATRRLDVHLRALPINGHAQDAEAPAPIGQWTTVHLHLGTAHHLAHVVLLEGDTLAPGQEMRAQLVLDADVFAIAGDRFILRNAQASQTIAGGTVLDPDAPERKRRSPERLAFLAAIAETLAQGSVAPIVRQAPHGMARSQLARLLGQPLAALAAPAGCVALGHDDPIWLADPHWRALQARVLAALARFHERCPDEPGVNAARLRRMALPGLAPTRHDALWHGLLQALLASGDLAQSGPWLHLPGHRVQLTEAEERTAAVLLPAIAAGRFDPPWVRDLATQHGLPEDAVRQLLRKLARQGRVQQVVKDLFYDASAIEALQAIVATLAAQSATQSPPHAVEARGFRDATGLGRKRAIQVLEHFDRTGYTRRIRDAHVLRQDGPAGEIRPLQ